MDSTLAGKATVLFGVQRSAMMQMTTDRRRVRAARHEIVAAGRNDP